MTSLLTLKHYAAINEVHIQKNHALGCIHSYPGGRWCMQPLGYRVDRSITIFFLAISDCPDTAETQMSLQMVSSLAFALLSRWETQSSAKTGFPQYGYRHIQVTSHSPTLSLKYKDQDCMAYHVSFFPHSRHHTLSFSRQ